MKLFLRILSALLLTTLFAALAGACTWHFGGSNPHNLRIVYTVIATFLGGITGAVLDWNCPGEFWFETLIQLILRSVFGLLAILFH